jgi:putative aldouronate transport system substrate-binding protein
MMKRLVMILMLVAILTSMLAAAARKDSASGAKASVPTYSYMVCLYNPEPPTKETAAWKALEKLVGANLDIWWTPNNIYDDRVIVSMASNELPNAFNGRPDIFASDVFISAAENGMLWEVGDAIAKSRYLSAIENEIVLNNAKINGKNYFIPRKSPLSRDGTTWRKDWQEKLGLAVPQNYNDLINMARAFGTRDPDGNGKNDTYAFVLHAAGTDPYFSQVGALTFLNGGGNGWVVEGDQLVPNFLTRPYLETLRLLRTLYAENLINQDFATIQSAKMWEMLNDEACGIFLGNADDLTTGTRGGTLLARKQAQNRNITSEDIWDFNLLTDATGTKRMPGGSGFYFGTVLPKSSNKTQADFEAIFNVFDTMCSEEGKILRAWGVEGVNYEIRNGLVNPIGDMTTQIRDVGNFEQVFPVLTSIDPPATLKTVASPLAVRIQQHQADAVKYAVMNPVMNKVSKTEQSRGSELGQIVADAATQYIMGAIDDSGFQAALNRWRTMGGNDIIKEYTQAWQAAR